MPGGFWILIVGCSEPSSRTESPVAATADTGAREQRLAIVADQPSVGVAPGAVASVRFVLERTNYRGPVEVTLEDVPPGFVVEPALVESEGVVSEIDLAATPAVPVGIAGPARLVARGTWQRAPEPASQSLFVFVRGEPGDPVFETGGGIAAPLDPGARATQVDVDSAGRVLVAVVTDDGGQVHRFDLAGRPDSTFGGGGVAGTTVGPQHLVVRGEAPLVAGSTSAGAPQLEALAADGSADPGFDAVALPTDPVALVAGPEGPIVAGETEVRGYTTTGAPGIAVPVVGLRVGGMALEPGGSVLVGGATPGGRLAVQRVLPEGATVDLTLTGGTVPLEGVGTVFLAASGDARWATVSTSDLVAPWVALRFGTSGRPDPTFGTEGALALDLLSAFDVVATTTVGDRLLVAGGRTDGEDGALLEIRPDGGAGVALGIVGDALDVVVEPLSGRAFVLVEAPGQILVRGLWLSGT